MVSPAIIGAVGGGAAGPGKSLWLDGTNVLKQLGSPGNLFGVPLDSIEHVDNAPPGVSSLKFTINDPQKAITVARGQVVLYHNHVTDRHYFRGWVQTWTVNPWGLGRRIAVRAIGVDALPDWLIVPNLTIPTGTRANIAIQMALYSAEAPPGVGPLKAGTNTLFGGSSASIPISSFNDPSLGAVTTIAPVVIQGKTLREAVNAIFAASLSTGFDEYSGAATASQFIGVVTVDPYLRLRAYTKDMADLADYGTVTLTVLDTVAGSVVADGLGHTVDAGDVPGGVYIQGGNQAGSGVTPGDGAPGPIRVVSDSTITTRAGRQAAAQQYLADRLVAPQRGGLVLADNAIATDVRAGSKLNLTDDMTGATGLYRISSITRTFTALGETWRVSYGNLPPSLPRMIRRLTRATLS